MDEYVKRRKESIEAGLGYIMRDKRFDSEELHMLAQINLQSLIRYNRRIQSLILNNTGLNM